MLNDTSCLIYGTDCEAAPTEKRLRWLWWMDLHGWRQAGSGDFFVSRWPGRQIDKATQGQGSDKVVIIGVRSKYTAKAPPLAMSSYDSNFLSLLMAKDGQWGQDLTTFGGYRGIPDIPMTPVSPQLDEPSYSDDWRFIGCNPPWFLGTQPLVCSSFLHRLLAGHSKKETPQTMVFPVFFLCSLQQPKQANILMFDDFRWWSLHFDGSPSSPLKFSWSHVLANIYHILSDPSGTTWYTAIGWFMYQCRCLARHMWSMTRWGMVGDLEDRRIPTGSVGRR